MKNPIEEFFIKQEGNRDLMVSREVFRADRENVDIRTDVAKQEIGLINALQHNDELLLNKGLKPVYKNYLNNYMRLKLSLDRKSRTEFVNINKAQDTSQDVLQGMANLSNITGVKK